MKLRSVVLLPVLAVLTMVLADSCNSNTKEHEAVEQQQSLYVKNQPHPVFTWSLERHVMVELYKARNDAVATYSYVRSPFTGKVLWSCPSIGFPIPYSTQITNPINPHTTGVPQPEPNGLYPPATALGTWVFCTNADGTVSPSYQEPNVETYLQPMKEVDGRLVPSGEPSIKIKTKQ